MITILANYFLRGKEGEARRKAYGTLCGGVGIALNFLLFIGKYFVGTISGSIAIVADAFNNLSDAGSSFITMVGFMLAGREPDLKHPFGHGRFEYVSGFIVSILILLMGFELMKSSLLKIVNPKPVDTSYLAMSILLISILVKVYMAVYNYQIGKKINSEAMRATALDSLSDTISTAVIMVAMVIMRYAKVNIDGICGLAVAGLILWAGYNAAKDTISPLLGKAPAPEFVKQIEEIVMKNDDVKGIHDLIVHDYGPGRCLISLHAEVPGDGDIYEIHDMIDCIERELNQELSCEAVIHMDPIETNNQSVNEIKKIVEGTVKEIDERLSIHDFRMVSGPTHTNLIFDVVVPFKTNYTKDELKAKIDEGIARLEGNYIAVLQFDHGYI